MHRPPAVAAVVGVMKPLDGQDFGPGHGHWKGIVTDHFRCAIVLVDHPVEGFSKFFHSAHFRILSLPKTLLVSNSSFNATVTALSYGV